MKTPGAARLAADDFYEANRHIERGGTLDYDSPQALLFAVQWLAAELRALRLEARERAEEGE